MLYSKTMILHFCGGLPKIGVKSGRLWSCGYFGWGHTKSV